MLVLIRSKRVPALVRGRLSRFLVEVESGTYIGDLSNRVRKNLWDDIVKDAGMIGSLWMVYPSPIVQKLEILSLNTDWELVNMDGVMLVERPLKTINVLKDSPLPST